MSATIAVAAGLLVQFGSLAIHSLTSFWPLPIAVAAFAFGLRLRGALLWEEDFGSSAARGAALLAAAVLNVALQGSARASATGGLNTGVRDGQYVLLNHAEISRRLSPEEYLHAFQTECALFASIGALIGVAALVAARATTLAKLKRNRRRLASRYFSARTS